MRHSDSSFDHYRIDIRDMTCSACVAKIEKAILSIDGVHNTHLNLVEKMAVVEGGNASEVVKAIIAQGYSAQLQSQKPTETLHLIFEQPFSTDELKPILNRFAHHITYKMTEVSLKTSKHPAILLIELKKAGFIAHYHEHFEDPQKKQAAEAQQAVHLAWQRAIIAASVGTFLMAGNMTGFFPQLVTKTGQFFWFIMAMLCLITMWYCGKNYYLSAIKQAQHFSSNMDTLVALGTSAAWISSLIFIINPTLIAEAKHPLYLDASVFILAFLQLGHALETKAKKMTREAIGALLKLSPKSATLLYANTTFEMPVSLLALSDQVRIKPGETIPIDGIVISGTSHVDESMITGESIHIAKKPGSNVIGGTQNGSGSLVISVTHIAKNTTLATIIKQVKIAQLSKPPIASLVDKITALFVPAVICLAILTFIAWFMLGPAPQLAYAFSTAITVLVIACPCALGLATPISIMIGTGRAAHFGILIKNSDALQSAANLTHLVVDKTGTLTEGKPSITNIESTGLSSEDILQLAASLEDASEHPLAEAVIQHSKEKYIILLPCENFKSISGYGICGEINQEMYFLGNEKLLLQQGIKLNETWKNLVSNEARMGGTPIFLSSKNKLLAMLVLKDNIREESKAFIEACHQRGLQIVMSTGDHHETATAVGKILGISTIHSELLPEQKLDIITTLQSQGHVVGMIGDGINDAPSLVKANTSFAIGSTDVAIENADITLIGNSLTGVISAIELSKATLTNIKQNLTGAFIYNVIGLPLAAGLFYPFTGWLLPPMFASFAMAMSSVTVVTNANRLRFYKPTLSNR